MAEKLHNKLPLSKALGINNIDVSVELMRGALTGLLKHVGLEPSTKYHETLTEVMLAADG
ncbi:MAG: hypothetical protein COA74_10815 [Gammaproteobacteria bacterium]|nr:MAG: hypothetical protein COA74_10815 [Gammaproteobacteria bacterium]